MPVRVGDGHIGSADDAILQHDAFRRRENRTAEATVPSDPQLGSCCQGAQHARPVESHLVRPHGGPEDAALANDEGASRRATEQDPAVESAVVAESDSPVGRRKPGEVDRTAARKAASRLSAQRSAHTPRGSCARRFFLSEVTEPPP